MIYLNAPGPRHGILSIMAQYAYATGPLLLECVEQCFPVAALDWPGLTLNEWRQFCEACIAARGSGAGGRSDVLVAIDSTGVVRAFCAYACDDDRASGRALAVSRFTVAHLVDAIALAAALLARLQEIARASGCVSVELTCRVRAEWAGALRQRFDIPVEHKRS